MGKIGALLKDVSTAREPFAAGDYTVELRVSEKLSKKESNPMVVISYVFTEGEYKGQSQDEYFVYKKHDELDPKALKRLKRRLKQIIGPRVNDEDFDTAECDGMLGVVTLRVGEGHDEDGNETPESRVVRFTAG